ncbi:Spore coat protein P [Fictibacillus macauensis ZFHKF-1]|uniref:Spore coat protein P n=1 Tax=Fictibacillus macauensis ZFHKF-1 TaxID=1196324 RepID=I8UB11_9BACL|nr:Hsp20/alpha crystallin family protein [Fictibacillus macauensis]EIT84120.1 Spore coat protein P [Fictibacillus macauensis ZFHKF-1]
MDADKLKQWLELAQKVQGNDFWNSIFDGATNGATGNSFPGQMNQTRESSNQFRQSSAGVASQQEQAFPKVDIHNNNREWIILFDLPGVRKEDVSLLIVSNQLTIRGRLDSPYQETTPVHKERQTGPFERTIPLPEIIQEARTSARFYNGLLEVRILRTATNEKAVRID